VTDRRCRPGCAKAWRPIRLTVDLTRLDGYRDEALALLLLVLSDLEQGRVPLGGMVNRGFGDITVTSLAFAGDGWTDRTLAQALGDEELRHAWSSYLNEVVTS
jgi:hypothetical protein